MSLDIPSRLHSCIVPLETAENTEFIGTGFFLQCYECKDDPSSGITILVTNRHIVEDRNIQLRVNIEGGGLDRTLIGDVVEEYSFEWVLHPDENIDLAVAMSPQSEAQMSLGIAKRYVSDVSSYEEGRELFFLGFPLAQGTDVDTQHHSILRMGTLSRKSDPAFIMEANVFPGSSGSPVFTKPRLGVDENGEVIIEPFKLLGVVSSYIPYQDVAVSKQTGRPRIIFEDNSGLSSVYKIQHISKILRSKEFTEQAKPIVAFIEDKSGLKLNPVFY